MVEDPVEFYPSFENVLFTSLEYARIQLYCMVFAVFESALNGNSMIAIFIVCCLEYILYSLRAYLGKANMTKKTYVDSMFLF